MKKLNKEQKENRIKRFRKAKDITLYISLALNTFFIICMAVVGCSPKSNDQNNNTTNNILKNQLVERNYANGIDIPTNEDCVCYDLSHLAIDKVLDPNNVYYMQTGDRLHNVDYKFSLICGREILTSANAIWVSYAPYHVQVGAYDSVNDPYCESPICYVQFYYDIDGNVTQSDHPSTSWNPPFSSNNGLYITYSPLNYQNLYTLDYFIPNFFDTVSYIDYDINNGWSPLAYYSNQYGVFNGLKPVLTYEWLINTSTFAINGALYTHLGIAWDNNQLLSGGYARVNAYVDGQVYQLPNGKPYSWPLAVVAYNAYSNTSISIWRAPTPTGEYENNNLTAETTYVLQGRINDTNLGRVRVFNVNGQTPTISGYTNNNVLSASYSGFGYSVSDGQFGNVFGLMATAFNGLASLLAIQVLPNLTLGILLFLPLVGLIIYALIKVFKK